MRAAGILASFAVTVVVAAQNPAPEPRLDADKSAGAEFEVASIKRNTSGDLSSPAETLPNGEVRATNTSVRNLILRAYPLPNLPIQVVGLPAWAEVGGDRYDVIARARPGTSAEQQQQMWRAFFADRLRLTAHYESKEQKGYNLIFARADHKLGPGLKPTTLNCSQPARRPVPGIDRADFATSQCGWSLTDFDGTMRSAGLTIAILARTISATVGRPVVDQTGLSDFYAVSFRFLRFPPPAGTAPTPDDPPSVFTALPEQLGLKLEPVTVDGQVLVIDHIERPSEN